MSAELPEGNDLPAFRAAPLVCDPGSFLECHKVGSGRKRELEPHCSRVVSDVEHAVAFFDGRRLGNVENGVKGTGWHKSPRFEATTEHGLCAVLTARHNSPGSIIRRAFGSVNKALAA